MPRNIKAPVKKSSARRQKNRAIQLEGSELEKKIDQSFTLKKIEPMTDAQQDVFDAFDEGYNLVLTGAAGTGKAQPLDASVLTPDGWNLMENLRIGGEVICRDGSSAKILGIYPQGITDVYEVVFDDDRKTECSPEHLWKVFHDNKYFCNGKVVTTLELLRLQNLKGYADRLRIELYTPKNSDPISLPLPPYLMGLLLGDGHFGEHDISFSTADEEIVNAFKENLLPEYTLASSSRYDYKIRRGQGHSNIYIETIRDLDLIGVKGPQKWIPPCFLNASLSQRLELIQGLMDSDGTADKSGSTSFCTTSQKLAFDMQQLVWSIGGIARISNKQTYFTHKGERKAGLPSFIVNIRYKDPKMLFQLQRKKDKVKINQYSETLKLGVKSVTKIESKETQCIMIDHPEHLYVTDNYIVTHNTFLSLYLALKQITTCRDSGPSKIMIIRSTVATRDVGHLPGTLEDKISVYAEPYKAIVNSLFKRGDAWSILVTKKVIEFCSTSYLRGTTIDNTFIFVDEYSNMSLHELETVMTRAGKNTRLIYAGDTVQSDLLKDKEKEGHKTFIRIVDNMESFDLIQFGIEDIVRSGVVKEYLLAKHKLGL